MEEEFSGGDPPRDGNGYQMFTPKEIEEILYLQSSDHRGMQLVNTPLNGTNYMYWWCIHEGF